MKYILILVSVFVFTSCNAELKKQYILVPPLSEQQSIVSYIDRKVAQIDTYISEVNTQLVHMAQRGSAHCS